MLALLSGERRLSYGELNRRADTIGVELLRLGATPGDRVALALASGGDYLEAMLGAFKARLVPVNINRHYVLDELRPLLADADVAVVVGDPELVALLGAAGETGVPTLVTRRHDDAAADYGNDDNGNDDVAANDDAADDEQWPERSGDDRYILYTGGTTGRPKAVEWRHEDLFFAALGGHSAAERPEDILADLAPRPSRALVASPLTHGTAQWAALTALLSGNTVITPATGGFDPMTLLDLTEQEAASQLVVVGDAFALPLADSLDAEPDRWSLEHLVVIASGGARLSSPIVGRLLAHLPGAMVVDGYGSSETGGQGRRILAPGQTMSGPPCFVMGEDTAVLNDQGLAVQPASGEIGRLARRSRVPLGYRNDAAATERAFLAVDGQAWVMNGDLARVAADGSVELLGRADRVINTGGEKVFPPEVEAAVLTHPAVHDAMVVSLPHPRFGEQVAAVVRLRPGANLSLERLRRHCQRSLARFKAPRRLIVVGELPRTVAGKPDHSAGAKLFS